MKMGDLMVAEDLVFLWLCCSRLNRATLEREDHPSTVRAAQQLLMEEEVD